jgi:hypothetical protein
MTRFFCTKGHTTIDARFSKEEFIQSGLLLADSPDDAEVIVSALMEELAPLIQRFGTSRKYLIWCDEPLWSNIFYRVDTHRTTVSASGVDGQFVSVDAMNCFTGNVLFTNHHFLLREYHLHPEAVTVGLTRELKALPEPGSRKTAAFLTFRNGGFWDYRHPTGILSLNTLRCRVALEGALFHSVDVYGKGWPFQLAKPESPTESTGPDPFASKLLQYEGYQFALCFENTWCPYYVSEKIWQAVLGGCLPIYHAGPTHTVYQDFPKASFIDYAEFDNPTKLFEFVQQMPLEEYHRRMTLCRSALLHAVQISNNGNSPRRIQIALFAERLNSLF